MKLSQKLIDRSGMDDLDREILDRIQDGLPLVSRPYARIAETLGMPEAEVIRRIAQLRENGIIKRLGVVVRHRKLGYQANAMVVWNVPDEKVDDLGRCFARYPFVTLCYQRPRRGVEWPYNLFCMIHGRHRDEVMEKVEQLARACGVQGIAHQVLFSRRCFKQRGANYRSRKEVCHG